MTDAHDRALRLLLEERFDAAASPPPDLVERILERTEAPRPPADSVVQSQSSTRQTPMHSDGSSNLSSFESVAESKTQNGLVREFCAFMSDNAKWWLMPFLLVFALLGGLVLLSTTGAAPFIYTLF